MSHDTHLWAGSAEWRWLLGITLLATGIVLLVGPWNKPSTPPPSLATYISPAQPVAQKSRVLTLSGTSPVPQVRGAVVGNSAAGPRDITFDVPVAIPSISFPSGTELHLIGVYESAPARQSEQAWWTKCLSFKDNQQAMAECHQKYAGQHPKTITVTVSRVGVPMVLALMAYEAVTWKLVIVPGAIVKKIILSGYRGPDITGIPENIPVDVHSYESSPCQICSRQPDHFVAYKKNSAEYIDATNRLRNLTGLAAATSFQGAYQSDRFAIGSYTAPLPDPALIASTQGANDPYIGQFFVNRIKLLDSVVPLPEGRWRGLAYARNASNRGRDEMVVIGLIDSSQLVELLAIRAQSVGDTRGFARHLSCDRNDVHAIQTIINESFGQQFCYWVNHVSQPWTQPILSLALSRLASLGVAAPDTLINAAFHKADISISVTAYYFKNPEAKGITSIPTTWAASPWHPQNINQFPEKLAFVQDRIQWAKSWFPIFKASK